MEPITNDLEKHKDRAFALDRALRLSVLFKKETFVEIQKVLSNPTTAGDETAFIKAARTLDTGLTDDELRWLHGYLKYFNKTLAERAELAASTPW